MFWCFQLNFLHTKNKATMEEVSNSSKEIVCLSFVLDKETYLFLSL